MLQHNINVKEHPDEKGMLISEHLLGNHNVKIISHIPSDFPFTLPTFHLHEREKYGALAHVAWGKDGFADIMVLTRIILIILALNLFFYLL